MAILLNYSEILHNTLGFCHGLSPLKFQREKPVQGFLTPDRKPGNSAREACSDDLIPEDKEFVVVHWHLAVNVIERQWQYSQRICCHDLDLVIKPVHLHHDTRLGRVNAAKMSNELMDKEIIILIQGSLLRLPLRFFQFVYRLRLRLLFILLRLRTAIDRDANSINIWNKMGMLNSAARVSPPATKVM